MKRNKDGSKDRAEEFEFETDAEPRLDEAWLDLLHPELFKQVRRFKAFFRFKVNQQGRELYELRRKNEKLEKSLAQAKEQLGRTSKNSHQPESQTPFQRFLQRSLREKSGRGPGKPRGAPGATRDWVEKPDRVVDLDVKSCPHCGHDLRKADLLKEEFRQLLDLKRGRVFVTEYCGEIKRCPNCDKKVRANFPKHVRGVRNIGPKLQDFAVFLKTKQMVPFRRVCNVLEYFFELRVSPGWAKTTGELALLCGVFLSVAVENAPAIAVAGQFLEQRPELDFNTDRGQNVPSIKSTRYRCEK